MKFKILMVSFLLMAATCYGAPKKMSELTETTVLLDTDIMQVVDPGVSNKKITGLNLRNQINISAYKSLAQEGKIEGTYASHSFVQSQPDNTVKNGSLTLLDKDDPGGAARSVWGDGTLTFVANGSFGLESYIVNPAGVFTLLDSDDQGGTAYGVWGDGFLIFLANFSAGLLTYSVDTSGILTFLDSDDQGGVAYAVWGNGTNIFLANETGGLVSYSVNSSGILTLLDSDFQSGQYLDVWGNNTLIFVAGGNQGLLTYSVDSSGILTFLDRDDQGGQYQDVCGDRNFIYVSDSLNNRILTYSVSLSGVLTFIAANNAPPDAAGIWCGGRYLYQAVGGGGIYVYKNNSSGVLTLISTIDEGGTGIDVWGNGSLLFLAADDDGVHSYSLDNAYNYDAVTIKHEFVGDIDNGFSNILSTGNIGRDADNFINFTTDDQLDIRVGGVTSSVVAISTGTTSNDELVTKGYVDDQIVSGGGWEVSDQDLIPVDNTLSIKIEEANKYKIMNDTINIEQNSVPDVFNSTDSWQSWTNASSAFLDAISLYKASAPDVSVTIFIYSGEGTGGTLLASKGPQVLSGTGFKKINLTTPVSIASGIHTMRIISGTAFDWGIAESNVYANGRFSANILWDAGFKIYTTSEYIDYNIGGINLFLQDFVVENLGFPSEYFRLNDFQLWNIVDDTSFGAISTIAFFEHSHADSLTTGSNGVGAAVEFLAPNSVSITGVLLGEIALSFTDVTSGSEDSKFDLELRNSGTPTNVLSIDAAKMDLQAISLGDSSNRVTKGWFADLDITNTETTTDSLTVQSDSLTTGSIARLASDSTSVSVRSLVEIVNDNTLAINVTPLTILQDAVISVNYKRLQNLGGVTIWISDGTTPNTFLSGTAGDICYNGPSGQAFYCSGGTTWVAM